MKLKLSALVFAFVLVFSLVGPAHAAFPDIQGHWAQPQVEKWAARGLAGGYPDGTFRPGGQVTRAEFVSFMNRALGKHEPGAACDFKDVKASDWYYAEVATAQTAGYLAGYEDGTFRPDSPISRQEVACVIARLDCLQDVTGRAVFADTGTIKPWALEAVGKVAAAGIMGGYPDNTFGPGTPISRAEAVVTLDRVVARCGEPVPVLDGVQGTVTLDGSPVEGAAVRLFTSADRLEVFEEYRTGKDGKYQFRVVSGKYGLTAVKGDYVAARTVTVTQDTVCDLALAAGTVLTGTLADKNGDPVPEAKLYFAANPVFFTTTDSDGNFRLAVLKDRTYTIWAHKDHDPSLGLVIIADNV
ncbi:MAG: S-layer homology domain-containing protein [Candidatus Desulforudis sp.]|nr:S-layer homology domain-containing protein [Desulforudis sp.]